MTSESPTAPASVASARGVATGVVVLTTALHALFSWQQWTALVVPSWDLAIFSQLAKAYSRFEAPIVPIKGAGFNLLGDHFHPLLVLLGPVWAAWPSGLTLLMVQAVLLGISAWPLTRLASEWHGPWWGAAFGLGYGVSWGVQAAVAAQFHEIALAVPLLAFSLAALLRERPLAAALWAAPLVFVKEDLGITVAVLGILIAWRFRRGAGLVLAAWGLVWTALAVAVILPALNPADRYDYTEHLVGLGTFLTPGTKWVTVAMLAATAGVVGVRSPLFLLVLPTLAWRFAGDVEQYWSWHWHYDAVLMPVVAAALLDAVRRPHAATTSASGTPLPGTPGPRASRPARAGLAVALGTTLVLGTSLPYATLLRPETWVRTWRWEPAERVLAAIPEDARVESDLTLLSYLVPYAEVSWVSTGATLPEFVVVDAWSPTWVGNPPADAAVWATDRWGTPFERVLDDGGFQLARRVPPAANEPGARRDGAGETSTVEP